MNGNQPPKHPESSKEIHGNIVQKVYHQETSYMPEDVQFEYLLAENEWLRQELYYAQNDETNRLINSFERYKYTLSHFVNTVDNIHQLTQIRKQDVYGIIYNTLQGTYGHGTIDFKQKKKTESKLRYIWRIGFLPHVMFVAKGMYEGLYKMKTMANQEFNTMCSKIQSEYDKQKQKGGVVKKPKK